MADRTLVVKLVGDEQDLLRSYTRAGRATKQFGDTTDSSLRKADKRFKSFKAAGAGFAGGLIASEVIGNLTTFIDKASESEAVLTQVRQGLKNTGQTWEQYGDRINSVVRSQSRLGFDDEELLGSFDRFNRQVGNVNKALRLNSIAMDVARGRSISLESATTLVTKAQAGQRGALTRLGIEIDKNATKTDLLRALTERYGGSAAAAGDDAATAQARLGVQLENIQETIGKALLPATSVLAENLADTAEEVEAILTGLNRLGKANIPVLNIPVNFELPGTDTKIGSFLRKVFDVSNPITGVGGPIGQVRNLRRVADRLVGEVPGDATDARTRSRRGPGGGPIVVESTVVSTLDGQVIAQSTTKEQQKHRRRNPRQKSGPNSAFR